MEEIAAPRLLETADETQDFDCGVGVLNDWLKKRALVNHLSGASRTYVATVGRRVVGFYCLAAGSVLHIHAPGSIRRNMPEPVPVVVMGRLAVDARFQKRGVGPLLLLHAGEQIKELAKGVGIRALLVHAKDEAAAHFYKRFGFIQSPVDRLTLMTLVGR